MIFDKEEIKFLKKHKGTYMYAYMDGAGFHLLPQDNTVYRVLPPLDTGKGVLKEGHVYGISDCFVLPRIADVVDWSSASVKMQDGQYVLDIGAHSFVLMEAYGEDMYTDEHKHERIHLDGYAQECRLSARAAKAVCRVSVCAGKKDSTRRCRMNGVYVDTDGTIVATDGRRLAWANGDGTATALAATSQAWASTSGLNVNARKGFFIPLDIVKYIPEESVYIACGGVPQDGSRTDERYLKLTTGDNKVYLFEAASDGRPFPNYLSVIPEYTGEDDKGDCEVDFTGLKAYKKCGRNDYHRVVFRGYTAHEDYEGIDYEMHVRFPSLELGEAVAMNVNYLMDVHKIFGKGPLSLRVGYHVNEESVVKGAVRFDEPDGDKHLLIMPMDV